MNDDWVIDFVIDDRIIGSSDRIIDSSDQSISIITGAIDHQIIRSSDHKFFSSTNRAARA
jgi:hypothetical protein